MKAEVEAEKAGGCNAGGVVVPAIFIAGGAGKDCDNGGDSDTSEEFIAEEIVGHIGGGSFVITLFGGKGTTRTTRARSQSGSLGQFFC